MPPQLTAEEREAANLVVEQVPRPAGEGRFGGGGGGPSLPDEFNAEFSALLGRGMTVLEIRDFLSGEFTPVPLKDLITVLRAREAAGSIRLRPAAQ